jgi:DNA-damage-inducible protein D
MSGNNPDYHFAGAGKPIKGGKGAVQVVDDYHLLRFAYVVCSVDRCGLAG